MSALLRGMTWSHPRGIDPLLACSARFQRETGVTIEWDRRSLQDFESYPVKDLAAQYDLIIIDHPHVGQITAEDCLLPLDQPGRQDALAALAGASIGPSFASYNWQERQWALPVDAAAQVQAFRPDRLKGPVTDLSQMIALCEAGKALVPLRPPHSLMCFFTLAAHLGTPCNHDGDELISTDAGLEAMDWLVRLTRPMPVEAYGLDPIGVLDAMGESDSPFDVAPFIYGYVSYSLDGFRPARIAFSDMPVINGQAPSGSAIGGTGLAVSARTVYPVEATDFAFFAARGDIQAGPYAASGGQPGHAEAWESEAVNLPVLDFYRNTRSTLEHGWLRPRHNGYMNFQDQASIALSRGLMERTAPTRILDEMNRLFRQFAPTRQA